MDEPINGHDWRPAPGPDWEICDRCGISWFRDDGVFQRPYAREVLTEMPPCIEEPIYG